VTLTRLGLPLSLAARYEVCPVTKAIASKRFYFYQRAKIASVKGTQRNRTLFSGGEGPLAELQSKDVDQAQLLATDSNGSVIHTKHTDHSEPLVYTAYGHSSSLPSDQTSSGFNGEFLDALEFYLLGAGYRLYYPPLMRLFSPDNLSPFAQGGINSYAYCGGDPVNFTDPSGHQRRKKFFGSMRKTVRRNSTDSTASLLSDASTTSDSNLFEENGLTRSQSQSQSYIIYEAKNRKAVQLYDDQKAMEKLIKKKNKNIMKWGKANEDVKHYDQKLAKPGTYDPGWNNRKRDAAIARRHEYRLKVEEFKKQIDKLMTSIDPQPHNTDIRRNNI
jgi:RHS repeat-associated protein